MRLLELTLLASLGASAAHGQRVCRPADAITARVITHLRREMADTTPISQQLRASRHLPAGAEIPVQVVTEDSVCRQARAAYVADTRSYNQITGQWNTPATRVYVLRVDTLYYVWDPGTTMGEFQLVITLDAHFNVVASLAD